MSNPPPEPWYPPPANASAAPSGRRVLIVVLAAVAVLGAAATAGVLVLGHRDTPPAPSVRKQPVGIVTTVATPLATTPQAEPTCDPLADLERLSAEGRAQVALRGQFAAQLASKYPGISDPLQTTESGSHTFAAADILAEHNRLRDAHSSDAHPVILLKSTDYGKRQKVGTHFLWVTFAVGNFPDRQSVLDWCAQQFTGLSAGELANQCAVRRLLSP